MVSKLANRWLTFCCECRKIVLKLLWEKKSRLQLSLHYPGNSEKKRKLKKFSPDVYSDDETGLLYQLMPDKTLSFKETAVKMGRNQSKG